MAGVSSISYHFGADNSVRNTRATKTTQDDLKFKELELHNMNGSSKYTKIQRNFREEKYIYYICLQLFTINYIDNC